MNRAHPHLTGAPQENTIADTENLRIPFALRGISIQGKGHRGDFR